MFLQQNQHPRPTLLIARALGCYGWAVTAVVVFEFSF
jgi:hypothetical protein